MKRIHIPTLILHGSLLVLAACTINDYHDFFFIAALIALIVYFIFTLKTKRPPFLTHFICTAIQMLVFHFGLIDVNSGAFGLGGGEFALVFYLFALVISLTVTGIVELFKHFFKE